MATKWISPTWRMPTDTQSPAGSGNNQSKFDNYSLDFPGAVSQRISVTASDTILPDQSDPKMSISAWIYMDTSSTAGRSIFNSGKSSSGAFDYKFEIDTSDNLHFKVRTLQFSPFYAEITGGTTISLNTWYYVTATWDGANLNLYLNGVADATPVAATSFYATSDSAPMIGARRGGASSYYAPWAGKLGQICYFDYALSETQVKYLHNNNDTVNPTVANPQNPMAISGNTPVAYYDLGGSSTGDAATSSPNTLTVPNSSVPSATVFDFASGDQINITNPTFLDNITEFTISFWYNKGNLNNPTGWILDRGLANGFYLTQFRNQGGYANGFEYRVNSSNGAKYMTSPANPTNVGEWAHVCLVWNSTNQIIYVNSIDIKNEASLGGTLNGSGNNLIIGNPGTSLFYDLSNFQIWNSTLLPSEITTLYNYGSPLSGTQPQAANLKAWYKMNVDTSNWNGSDWEIGNSATGYTTAFDFKDGFEPSPLTLADSFETSFNPNGYTKLTFSVWAYVDNFHGKNTFFATFENTSNKYADNNVLITTSRSVLYISINGNSICGVNVGGAFSSITPNDVWNSITIVYDGTFTDADITIQNAGRLKFYSNGVYKAFNLPFTNNVPSSIIANGLGTRIGARTPTSGNGSLRSPLVGKLSNLQIWNESLTPSEVIDVYNNGTPLQSNIPQSGSLKAWWKMDSNNSAWNGSNWSITDSSGEGNTGTSYGMVESNLIDSLVTRLNGTSSGMTTANLVNSDLERSISYSSYSMDFDAASSDYVSMGNVLTKDGSTAFSISCWIKYTGSGTMMIVSKQDASGIGYLLHSGNFAGVKLSWYPCIASGGNIEVRTSNAYNDGNWHNVLATYDGSGNASGAKIYVDGALDTNIITDTFTGTSSSTGPFQISARNGTSFPFDGNVSNTAVWSSELTQDQILTIYNGGVPNSISSLSPVGWWSLAGDSYYNGTDFICPDLSSNSNNGTSNGMGGTELVGNGPGSEANGVGTGMNIPGNLQGNAPNSSSNAFSVNMNFGDKTSDVPAIP